MAREGGDKVSIIGTADVDIKGPLGRDTDVNSLSVALSTEDVAILNKIAEPQAGGTGDTGNGKPRNIVGNVTEKWKVGYGNFTEFTDNFTEVAKAATDLVFADGNVAGSSYIDICKDALTPGASTTYLSKNAFRVPYVLETGVSFSQRFQGQDFFAEMVGVNATDDGTVTSVISTMAAAPADNPISASITVATNVWTVTLTNAVFNNYRVGDWVYIYGCADSRLNVGKTQITAIGSSAGNILQITSTLADGTYTGVTGGYVAFVCPCGGADYHHGTNFYGTTNSNADAISRNGPIDSTGSNNRARVVPWNPGNTNFDSAVPSEGINYASMNYARPFRAKSLTKTEHTTGFLHWINKDQDSTTVVRATSYRESEVPAQDKWYALRWRSDALKNMSVPVGSQLAITAISKSGSTTWTVTCPGHTVTVNDRVRLYGMNSQANFANITTDTQVNSVIDADTFTIISTTGTATSYGGVVIKVNGGAVPTLTTIAVQSYQKSYDGLRLILNGSGTWVDVVGNVVTVVGLVNSSNIAQTALHGRYRVARISTTILELEPLDGQAAAIAAISGTVTAGGTIIRNTSMRLHYTRVIDYTRILTEPVNPGNNSSRSAPVYVTGFGASVNSIQSTRATVGSGWYVEPDNLLVADIASAAITSTATSSTITPTPVGAASVFTVAVTATSGTTPTMDIAVEESDDTGTNWYRVYEFPRITANGFYRSPNIRLNGNRIRYVRTIAGTTPSFTMSLNRITHQMVTPNMLRQRFDRSITLTTLSSTSGEVVTGGASNYRMDLRLGAVTTTVPQVQIQGTNDNGVSWTLIGSPLVGVASSTVTATVTGQNFDRIRAIVTTAGVGVTSDYLMLRAYDA